MARNAGCYKVERSKPNISIKNKIEPVT